MNTDVIRLMAIGLASISCRAFLLAGPMGDINLSDLETILSTYLQLSMNLMSAAVLVCRRCWRLPWASSA